MNRIVSSQASRLIAAAGLAGVLLASGSAFADNDRTRRAMVVKEQHGSANRGGGNHDNNRGNDRGNSGGHQDRGHDRGGNDRSRVSVSIGINSGYRSGSNIGWAGSYTHGRIDRCDPPVYNYRRYDPPCNDRVVIFPAPCPPPVYIEPCPPRTVVIERPCPTPVYVGPVRTTYVQPSVYVQPATYVTNIVSRESADEQFRAGRLSIAADLYRVYLREVPTDDTARRSLAFCLVQDNKIEDAIGMMASAYEQSPTLARTTQHLASLPDGGSLLGARFNEIRTTADRTNSASAYLTAAIVAQSIGNYQYAITMLDRARQCGLSEKVGTELAVAVTSVGR